ncbi:hypothetical protein B0H13DRAFT_1867672 [Mycena leptocephala]|nr:hypothetical protein B0H13DRAFT_1867672 [Mycena leptocephala]
MALGPNFGRPAPPAAARPLAHRAPEAHEQGYGRGRSGAALLHVRESALGAVLCFLKYNSGTLVTLDLTRRIASVLGNALAFATGLGCRTRSRSRRYQQNTVLHEGTTRACTIAKLLVQPRLPCGAGVRPRKIAVKKSGFSRRA